MKKRNEAKQIIQKIVNEYRNRSYAKLCAMIGSDGIFEQICGESGQEYQIEIQIYWDDKKDGDVRLIGSISPFPDSPIWTDIPLLKWVPIYSPLATEDFIMNSSGNFVGE